MKKVSSIFLPLALLGTLLVPVIAFGESGVFFGESEMSKTIGASACSRAPTSLIELASFIICYVNATIPLLIGAGLVFFLVGVVRYIYQAGDHHAVEKNKQLIIWGIVALFVMISFAGIVALIKETFL